MGSFTTAKARHQRGTSPTVMVVDDDPAVRKALSRLLRSAGFRVLALSSGEETLAALDGLRPACMIVDLQLRGMSGVELVSRFRAKGATTPVIFITGHPDALEALESREHSALACLKKPFDDELLLSILDEALAKA